MKQVVLFASRTIVALVLVYWAVWLESKAAMAVFLMLTHFTLDAIAAVLRLMREQQERSSDAYVAGLAAGAKMDVLKDKTT